MENQENKDASREAEHKHCLCCGGAGKILAIIIVFLLGGIIGYLKGHCCKQCMPSACMHQPMEAGHAAELPAKPK